MEIHNIKPIIQKDSEILILGSFPSVKSRKERFYYANPRNRFYQVLSYIYKVDLLNATCKEKEKFFIDNRIAIFDVVKSCTIRGSDDNSIEDVIVNDIPKLIYGTSIRKIYVNGTTAGKILKAKFPSIEFTVLPSTSPANAQYSLDKLIKSWKIIKY